VLTSSAPAQGGQPWQQGSVPHITQELTLDPEGATRQQTLRLTFVLDCAMWSRNIPHVTRPLAQQV